MYPPTLREITLKMSNLYSTQTKEKQLYLRLDEVIYLYHIAVQLCSKKTHGLVTYINYNTIIYTMKVFQMECEEII